MTTAAVGAALTLAAAMPGLAQHDPLRNPDAARERAAARGPAKEADASAGLPHVTVDREARIVEIDAQVVNREVDWLELLLCTEGGREHETILTTAARPSHVHLALILIGLQPGQVQRGEPIDPDDPGAGYRLIPAEGPAVNVELVYSPPKREHDEDHEHDQHVAPPVTVDAGAWVYDRRAEQTLAGTTWLFTGSKFVRHEGRPLYVADLSGTLISLVNFGDDVLAPRTDKTNRNDEQALGCHTPAIPPVGTPVTVRLSAADAAPPGGEPRENEGEAD